MADVEESMSLRPFLNIHPFKAEFLAQMLDTLCEIQKGRVSSLD